MEHKVYEESFILRYRDVDMHGRWRSDSILYLMQECVRDFEKEHGPIRAEDLRK